MAQPSRDRANDGTMPGMWREAFTKLMQGVDGMLPAVVVAYDRTTNMATVRPVIKMMNSEGQLFDRAQVASVPVLAVGGGNFVISFPVSPGDFGWIEASDRDISLWAQTNQDSGPNTLRMHSFSDGRFIPDKLREFTIAGEDEGGACFQSLDNSSKVVLRADGSVVIQATDGKITVSPAGKFSFESATDELMLVLKDFTDVMAAALVNPGIPFTDATIEAIEAITARLEAMTA